MALGDRRLEPVRAQPAADASGRGQRGPPAPDRRPVPAPPVLVGEQHRLAVASGAGGEPRGGELEQGEQAVDLGLVGHQPGEDPGQPDRLVGQVGPDQVAPDVADEPSVKIT